jgi:DNA repair protein RadC
LSSWAGIGPSKAARLVASFELGRRAASRPMTKRSPIRSSRDIVAALTPLLADSEVERFLAIPADARNRPIGRIELAKGGLHACPVSPADAFRSLLRAAASGVVFVHNHPSGDPSPSPEDIALTDRLERAGELVGVRVLAHVILAREGSFSFADAGLLPGGERG